MADMDAEIQRSDRRCAGGSVLPHTPNSQGYTVAQFAQDIKPLLPLALPEFRRCGLMKGCANCGKTLDGVTFVLRNRKLEHGIAEAHLLAICNTCATSPADLSPNDWPHARVNGGLLLQEYEWEQFTRVLRRHVMTRLHDGFGGVILTTTDTP